MLIRYPLFLLTADLFWKRLPDCRATTTTDWSDSELTCAREQEVQVVQDAHDLIWLRHIYPTPLREPSNSVQCASVWR